MLGPAARSRLLGGAAALLTLAGASAVLGVGSSPPGAPATTALQAPFVGPVALAPRPRPLVALDGPLLLPVGPDREVRGLPPMGPRVEVTPTPAGPPAPVGPDSGLAEIRAVQRLLNAAGARLRVDGAWGPATTRAVEQLQARHGLPVDGRIGPATAALLRRP